MPEKSQKEDQKKGYLEASLEKEMESSYLDYAMSVIVSRALPDVRDGLKPVQRRILYAMWRIGLRASAKSRKSAYVIGEVLGKFHPHGELSVYDALVRMAQDFSLRYPLVNGQGNFGSLDGDSAAAHRYTEAKLSALAEEIILDLEKKTVNFTANYDGTLQEPTVLPGHLPNLLLNGASGIAVGVATNIPPHNLTEVCQAIIYLIDHPQAIIDELMQFIKGPDFPTGGLIFDPQRIKEAYALGRGGLIIRAKTEIIENRKGDWQVIITEIPYQVNKSTLLEKIAELVKNKKIEEIKEIKDLSNREGIKIVLGLKKHSYPQKVLNRLFTLTPLQETYHFNFIALINGLQPRSLSLKNLLEEYIKHRQVVVRKRTEYNLQETHDRIHLLLGFKIALQNIEAIVKLIKQSKDRELALLSLQKKFRLTEKQSSAILEMRLQQLVNLEREKNLHELKEKQKLARELKTILEEPKKISEIIKKEVNDLKNKYGDERRTKIVAHSPQELLPEDLVPDEPAIIVVTKGNYIKRISPQNFKVQNRGGKGIIALTTKEEDMVEHLFFTSSHAHLLFFTDQGKVFKLKTYEILESSRLSKGTALVNFLQIKPEEKVSALFPLKDFGKNNFLVMVTKLGLVKRIKISSLAKIRRSGLVAINLKNNDSLSWVKMTQGGEEIILVSGLGQSVRFKEKEIRVMGRTAQGVRGMKLKKGDQIVGMDVLKSKVKNQKSKIKEYLLVVSEMGFGKKTDLKFYRQQKRGGSGLKTAKISGKTGKLVSAIVIDEKKFSDRLKGDLIIISQKGQTIRLPIKRIPCSSRATQGVHLMRFKEKDDAVASISVI